ncbi:MAG: hypothetical protein ACE5F1_02835 [Planctomycetota bacterium]
MRVKALYIAPLALGAMAVGARVGTAQVDVGASLPSVELEGFANTKARSLADFAGRTVLIEFFAYW